MEEPEVLADAAVVPLAGLLEAREMGFELLLRSEGRAVDALELGARLVASEVGPRRFE